MNGSATPLPHTAYEAWSVIDTERLVLRPLGRSDAARIVRWRARDAAKLRKPQPSLDEHFAWFDSERRGRVDYTIVDRSNDLPIGVVNYSNIDDAHRTADVGKLIGERNYRGRGLAKEASTAWLLYGFGALGLDRIDSWTLSDNHANIHVNTKLGFVFTDESDVPAAEVHGEFRRMSLTLKRFLESVTDFDPSLGPLLSIARTRSAPTESRKP